MKKLNKKSILLILLALVLVAGFAVGGTLAWLTDQTDPVKNVFTTSDIDITLTENEGTPTVSEDEDIEIREFKMVPGATIAKNPKVTVKAGSEKCWLFVKVEKSQNFDTFMTCTMADVWTELTEGSGIYYREVDTNVSDQGFDVIKDNKVTVKDDVTKEMMSGLTVDNYPKLTFTAYACQYANGEGNFTAAQAWAKINPTPTPTPTPTLTPTNTSGTGE